MMLILFICLLVSLASVWLLEKRRIARIVEPETEYWVNVVQSARNSRLSSIQFIKEYGDQVESVSLSQNLVQMKTRVAVGSLICKEYFQTIYYSFDPTGGANLYGIMANGCE